MKKIIITSLILLSTIFASAQVKKEYYIESVPCYDSVGNVTIYKQTYDHIPTKEDIKEFYDNLEWRISIQSAIDYTIKELKKQGYIVDDKKKKQIKKHQ